MARSRSRPPRRWVLGILFVSVSLLTALSLPGPQWGSMTGPFGQFWVLLWVQAFGMPGIWLILGVGLLWGLGLLLRWQRGFLWALSGLIAPTVVAWDAWMLALLPAGRDPLLHGSLAWHLHEAVVRFFGADARVQHGLALSALAVTGTVFLLRWGLPPALRGGVVRGLAVLGASMVRGLRALGAALSWTARVAAGGAGRTHRGVLVPACAGVRSALHSLRSHFAEAEPERGPGEHAVDDDTDARAPFASSDGRLETAPTIAWDRPPTEQRSQETRPGALPTPPDEAPGPRLGPAQGPVYPRDALPAPERRAVKGGVSAPAARRGAQALATLGLLEEIETGGSGVSQDEIRENAVLLTRTLASFGIQGEVSEVHPGPIITRYEFTPGVGVTISQIVSRQDDLALAMRAPRVRLLAPIPGKAAVGVEIPNREPALISFKEVVTAGRFLDAKDPLAVALGKDVAGRPFFASLEKMPHLLVAGTTGSGKSVCMNTLIVSLLLRCTPERLRLLMIDPKMLEFTTYNEIPHLLRPVVTNDREAARALRWLTKEMEHRYKALASLGVRNIAGYDKKRAEQRGDEQPPAMPYIVVFVDELADLMLSNPAEIELPIARLAQMARAVGIHLVLATQRPSVDVITGVIKANFPARIAFQVASRTDSRTVLDMNGAESLLGRGDMLFIPPGKAQAHRIHGAFLSDADIEKVAAYLRQFPAPDPLMSPEAIESDGIDEEDLDDPLFGEALRIVVAGQQGSTSMLQRRLRIGYTRAGRLMDMLEQAGIVGPPDGSRAREVLVPPDYLEQEHGEAAGVGPKAGR